MVSRMAAPRQRYEIEQAAQGRPIGVKPKTGVPPFDTHGFAEVVNRLQRFQGRLRRNVAGLKATRKCPPELISELKKTIDISHRLRIMVRDRGTEPGTSGPTKPISASKKPPTPVGNPHGAWIALRQVNGVLQKCLRDIPRLETGVKPTKAEKQIIENKLAAINTDARAVLGCLKVQPK